jgi:hypothetical protein
LIELGGRSTVTAEATGRAPAGDAITEAYCRAALRGQARRLTTTGKIDPTEGLRL